MYYIKLLLHNYYFTEKKWMNLVSLNVTRKSDILFWERVITCT